MAELGIKDKKEIIQEIRKFIIGNFLFGNASEMVGESDSFMENGIIDSTGILELIEHVEEQYSITVEDDELIPENLDSLENISAFIQKKNN
ncbi:acyl carrier protein [Spirochaeta isovalerica]|uniref:Acyl carrier protein n=1 Tax=Spirochaeta isovalerica TaxID=150 RepID=A0A841R602_9SPIO|nr:acyl carrier protein [Spirochaeta isovalerica]MBB6479266.1 acyl carrier protein [Spirochaeta isovalerica]